MIQKKAVHIIYIAAIIVFALGITSPIVALISGLLFSVFNLQLKSFSNYSSFILKAAIVILGFNMDLNQVIETSKSGFSITAISVTATLLFGLAFGRLFKLERNVALLISAGTAICGGSAIAAVAPTINAKNHQISFALIVVFVLNALALILFPYLGHLLNMSQEAFGTWSAIAIHDTSSVVGAGAAYGEEALKIATTVKLTRSLWIIPVSLTFALYNKQTDKVQFPWFIALFVLAILTGHFVPNLKTLYNMANYAGHQGMTVALFLIGSGISLKEVKNVGFKSFIQGLLLWILISAGSLLAILSH